MPKCTDATVEFGRLGRRVIEANFEGGDISSDGGLLLLRRVDERIGLSRAAACVLDDPRDGARITHGLRELLAQRIYGLCCGYEDLNDHDTLRSDLLMQTAVGRVDALASSPTLSRLETRATREQAVALHGVLVEQFVKPASLGGTPGLRRLPVRCSFSHQTRAASRPAGRKPDCWTGWPGSPCDL